MGSLSAFCHLQLRIITLRKSRNSLWDDPAPWHLVKHVKTTVDDGEIPIWAGFPTLATWWQWNKWPNSWDAKRSGESQSSGWLTEKHMGETHKMNVQQCKHNIKSWLCFCCVWMQNTIHLGVREPQSLSMVPPLSRYLWPQIILYIYIALWIQVPS